jgi:hypothetical protein
MIITQMLLKAKLPGVIELAKKPTAILHRMPTALES